MRQIEKEMLNAIANGRDWGKDNTTVAIDPGAFRSYHADVYLHGNHIAMVHINMAGDFQLTVNVETLGDYPTRTTMSRLRALGVDVCTRKGVVLLNGKPLGV